MAPLTTTREPAAPANDGAPESRARGALRAAAIALPAAVLAWGWPSVLAGDLAPEASAAGYAALLALPAAALTLLAPPARRPRGLLALFVAAGLGATWLALSTLLDTFEADRAVLGALAGVTMLLAGAGLDARGRRALVRLGVVLGLVLVAGGWLDASRAGPLGNTGDLAEAALPCALLGLVLAAGLGEEPLPWRVAGGALALAFAAWCLRTPSIAGAGALGLVALVAGAARLGGDPRQRGSGLTLAATGLVVLALLGATQLVGARRSPAEPVAVADTASEGGEDEVGDRNGDLGGVGVRRLVWNGTLALVRAHPWTGVGPGQFARAFPPHRDPREIELSTLGRALPGETEVEHPHNDWLVAFAELGVPGGVAWCAFLLVVLAAAWRGLRATDVTGVALGAAGLAVLADALVHAPLTDNPAASTLAFGVFGALLARSDAPVADHGAAAHVAARVVPATALALLVLAVPDARSFVRHGDALSELTAERARHGDDSERALARRSLRALDEAVAARPDSALAHTLRARFLATASGDTPESFDERLAAWRAVLAQRPHRFEALMQTGTLHARRIDTGGGDEAREARAYYEHAAELDPAHPGLLRNRARLELVDGRVDAGVAALDTLEELGERDPAWLERLGAELLLRGLDREAHAVLRRVGEANGEETGDDLWARARLLRDDDERALLADAYEAQAHRLWARGHAAAERYHDAVRSYRQCLRLTLPTDGGALRVRMELAAAALLEGDEETALERLDGARPSAADWAGMPSWAGEALIATGWFGA